MTAKNDLATPSIHLNGTSKDELLKQVVDAHAKLSEALTALSKSAPHKRDYYIQANGDDNYRRAVNQYVSRSQRIIDVQDELKILAEDIFNGGFQGDRK